MVSPTNPVLRGIFYLTPDKSKVEGSQLFESLCVVATIEALAANVLISKFSTYLSL